ncbi:hypothetical protein PQR39_41420 [Paraburkholderia sediminicola]|uniref:hypothetical protein n=1 Tax=Paraburkholderia sediminicola TaxID=458836 RepID=UPI0038B8884D
MPTPLTEAKDRTRFLIGGAAIGALEAGAVSKSEQVECCRQKPGCCEERGSEKRGDKVSRKVSANLPCYRNCSTDVEQ